jgi:hypothetical protein
VKPVVVDAATVLYVTLMRLELQQQPPSESAAAAAAAAA